MRGEIDRREAGVGEEKERRRRGGGGGGGEGERERETDDDDDYVRKQWFVVSCVVLDGGLDIYNADAIPRTPQLAKWELEWSELL